MCMLSICEIESFVKLHFNKTLISYEPVILGGLLGNDGRASQETNLITTKDDETYIGSITIADCNDSLAAADKDIRTLFTVLLYGSMSGLPQGRLSMMRYGSAMQVHENYFFKTLKGMVYNTALSTADIKHTRWQFQGFKLRF